LCRRNRAGADACPDARGLGLATYAGNRIAPAKARTAGCATSTFARSGSFCDGAFGEETEQQPSPQPLSAWATRVDPLKPVSCDAEWLVLAQHASPAIPCTGRQSSRASAGGTASRATIDNATNWRHRFIGLRRMSITPARIRICDQAHVRVRSKQPPCLRSCKPHKRSIR
jgi:hypothetical protein